MQQSEQQLSSKHNFMFWFHVFITSLAWVGPFLFSWQIMVGAYTIILLQFFFFDKCLLNAKHDLTVSEDATFYSYLFEAVGMKNINRPLIKVIVRRYLYFILGAFSYFWQEILGFEALLF
jgi:hypothetical protein